MNIYIETYGCQMNVADSELVKTILIENGHQIVKKIDFADVIIFNTCSVRQHAENRVIGRITNESSRKAQNKNIKIGMIGCVAQRMGKELLDKKIGLDFVLGVDQYLKLPEILTELKTKKQISKIKLDNKELYNNLYPTRNSKYHAFVTIMRGCNNFCTYCIVPYTRGRERSRPYENIISEIEKAGKTGRKNIILLGQNVNSYDYENVNFPQLLEKINRIDSIRRIRFITSHPKDLSDQLIQVMAKSEKVCEHIHLAMQSGNDEILRKMNRGYTANHFLNLTKKLRKAMPDIAITTDVIAGFPGETETQFNDTYQLMKKIEFDYAFTFKYSPREGTKAAQFENQVAESIRLKRLQKLIKLQEKVTHKKYREQIGKIQTVFVGKVSKKSDKELAGKTRDFKITVFEGNKDLIGSFVKVKIVDATGWTLKGKLIKKVE